MTTFSKILVATDLDDPSEAAARVALAVAHDQKAILAFAHVYALPATVYSAYPDLTAMIPMEGLEKAAQRALAEWLVRLETPPRTQQIVVAGEPAQALLDQAAEWGANLLVVGTHGRRGVSRALLGSTAEKLVRYSTIPVLTVRSPT